MAVFSLSSFFSNVCANGQVWKKVGVGVAAVGGVVGAHYYYHNAPVSRDGILSSASLPGSIFSHSHRPWIDSPLPFACLASPSFASFTEPSTGVSFPSSISPAIDDKATPHQLTGVGLRKKSILGLKNITVYVFGVYANEENFREKVGSKYMDHSVAALKESKPFHDDIVASDFDLTVRLVIVYGRLKVGSVRSAFEESIGSRIHKFSGKADRPLLESFTSLFKDDIKLPKGTTIDVRRQPGYILTTAIDGKDIGSVQSPLLCRAFCDLYIGDEPFDLKGKEDVETKLAAFLSNS